MSHYEAPLPLPKTCFDIREFGGGHDAVYTIFVSDINKCGRKDVFCEQQQDGGGWTVSIHSYKYVGVSMGPPASENKKGKWEGGGLSKKENIKPCLHPSPPPPPPPSSDSRRPVRFQNHIIVKEKSCLEYHSLFFLFTILDQTCLPLNLFSGTSMMFFGVFPFS